MLKNVMNLLRKPILPVTDSKNFPSKGLQDTDSKNNKERVRYVNTLIMKKV